ncbi:uncharacterized protein PV09_02000 [Verruconis gallopava]|uniref:DUF4048 domain-containing protein n=1 Tax=Verruconis gallopava TaxID=253628 RepID=A0A0D1Z2G1_9PEZI|nr:uncharacterized protein PV09_02000 [Verruconis gallopava]KIW07127.1 hypothetical protein PV09_02000 [Verruconis gallopava]
MLVQPCYAVSFWRQFRRLSSTVIGRLLQLDESLITFTIYGALLLRHLVLSTLFDHSPKHSPYLSDELVNDCSRSPKPLGVAMDDASHPQQERSRKQRPNSIMTVDSVLGTMTGPNSPRRPPPSERLPGSPSTGVSYASSQMSASPTKIAHSRSKSVVDSPRRLNRLSMSFPVLPPSSARSRPTSWANSPVISPIESLPSPSTEGNFLTQLASQERRVLELREALRQAESELERLKKHWATHEALKKRADVKRMQPLQPLSASLSPLEGSDDDQDGSSQWLQREMERRKALLSGIKTSNRKVLSGSKHTRTLSLLSPEKGTFSQPFPQPTDSRQPEENPYRSQNFNNSSNLSATTNPSASLSGDSTTTFDGPSKDAILRTGKQMANDIKDGLWTFFEDIRQATIGEEATLSPGSTTPVAQNKPRPLKRSNTTGTTTTRTARSARAAHTATRRDNPPQDALIDIGGSFWREHGVESPVPPKNKKQQPLKVTKQTTSKKNVSPSPSGDFDADSSEVWDSWDTPVKSPVQDQRQQESDTTSSDAASDGVSTPLTDENSRPTPRTSTSSKRNSIPWPDLEKLTPSSLKRTASHLMKEWEKSLTPSPPVERDDSLGYVASPCSTGGKAAKSD